MRMATPATDQTSLLEGKTTLLRMKMHPGSHLGCLEMGQDASSAVWFWEPHIDSSALGKTCRIRFCNNNDHLQPGAPRVVGTRQGIPVSLHGGTHARAAEGWGTMAVGPWSPISVPPSMLASEVSHAFCWWTGGQIKVVVSPPKTLQLQSHWCWRCPDPLMMVSANPTDWSKLHFCK